MGRVLGIDYGTVRVGLALSDPEGTIAFPHAVITPDSPAAAVRTITDLCRARQVDRIVLGLPLHLDGREGTAVKAVHEFARELEAGVGLPVILWDERLSSHAAERHLIAGGVSRRKRRQLVDKMAAQLVLQSYLDSLAWKTSDE